MNRITVYLLASAAFFAACTTDKVLEEVEDISGSTDPMRFTVTKENLTPDQRAANPLTSGFMVSAYKLYGQDNQQTVMPQYEVRYHVLGDAWNGRTYSSWTYDDVKGQNLRYWDYSAFPYRFNAIAPYPANPAGFVLTDQSLKINVPYSAQTCINGMVTPADNAAEPHLLSQVQRGTDGKDTDLLALSDDKTVINDGSTTKNRDVWMPFHHLNSKIRFGIYHNTQWLISNKTYIKDLIIKVTSPNFVTGAGNYQSKGTGGWRISTGNSGFKELTKAAVPYEIFCFDGGQEIEDNDLTERQTRKTAYFMQCPGGMMQIPQEHVEMTVSFKLYTADDHLYKSFTDVPVRLEKENHPGDYQTYFDWKSGYIYTYYLVINEIDEKLEVTFTATLTPWEDVAGSLSTDLEK